MKVYLFKFQLFLYLSNAYKSWSVKKILLFSIHVNHSRKSKKLLRNESFFLNRNNDIIFNKLF